MPHFCNLNLRASCGVRRGVVASTVRAVVVPDRTCSVRLVRALVRLLRILIFCYACALRLLMLHVNLPIMFDFVTTCDDLVLLWTWTRISRLFALLSSILACQFSVMLYKQLRPVCLGLLAAKYVCSCSCAVLTHIDPRP